MRARDTFWNIPHWAEIGQYVLGSLAILVFAHGVYRHVRRWRMGQPEPRADRLGKRLWGTFVQVVGQFRTTRAMYAGIMHLMIFWGMIALLFGTILATVDWEVAHLFFGTQFLTGTVYIVYELVLDIFGMLLLVGLGMAAYRRYIIRPPALQRGEARRSVWDDVYVIVILVLVAVTGYLVEGLRIAVLEPDWARWSPVGNALASVFKATGDPTNRDLHVILWIGHGLVAFVFIASIPYTKLFHIVALPLNVFFRSFQPVGMLPPVCSTSEAGVKEIHQFTWKQLLNFETCVSCGRCQDVCPSCGDGKPLSPKLLIMDLRDHLKARCAALKTPLRDASVQVLIKSLVGDIILEEAIWSCTTCYACDQECPLFVEHVTPIVDMRRHLVMEGRMDAMLQDALANLGRYGNSFGQSERARAKWTRSLTPKIKDARREAVEYLWFVGDYASYHPGLTPITVQTAEVFQKIDLDFGIVYEGEHNAGNDVRRVGEEGLFEMLVEQNTAAFDKCTFETIVTTDPHSYNTLKNEYPANGNGHRPVVHYAELLDQLITSGQLKFSKKLDYKVTYQDPCYLGRYNGIYDAPRRVIEATGCKLVEMPHHRDRSHCCGAGGGRIWMEEGAVSERPSEARIREAVDLDGVQAYVVACPKDVTMFQDAVKTTGHEDHLVVKDLIELVHEAL